MVSSEDDDHPAVTETHAPLPATSASDGNEHIFTEECPLRRSCVRRRTHEICYVKTAVIFAFSGADEAVAVEEVAVEAVKSSVGLDTANFRLRTFVTHASQKKVGVSEKMG